MPLHPDLIPIGIRGRLSRLGPVAVVILHRRSPWRLAVFFIMTADWPSVDLSSDRFSR
jgi:hypothetical protein